MKKSAFGWILLMTMVLSILPMNFSPQQDFITKAVAQSSGYVEDAQAWHLHDKRSDQGRFVVLILGDGYTADDETTFANDAVALMENLQKEYIFEYYNDWTNYYALFTPSNVSGQQLANTSTPLDTFYGASYNTDGIDRLLHYTNEANVQKALKTAGEKFAIESDLTLMLVNCDKYGGAGGEVAVASTNEYSVEIMLHEIGHSLAGLSDEYYAGDQFLRENVNLTQESDPSAVPWSEHIGTNGIGVYQMEGNPGWYIPHQNCKMKSIDQPFCDVCYYAVANTIYEAILN